MGIVGLIKDGRKGWALAGLLLSSVPFWYGALCR
jgi:hypothetical protein